MAVKKIVFPTIEDAASKMQEQEQKRRDLIQQTIVDTARELYVTRLGKLFDYNVDEKQKSDIAQQCIDDATKLVEPLFNVTATRKK